MAGQANTTCFIREPGRSWQAMCVCRHAAPCGPPCGQAAQSKLSRLDERAGRVVIAQRLHRPLLARRRGRQRPLHPALLRRIFQPALLWRDHDVRVDHPVREPELLPVVQVSRLAHHNARAWHAGAVGEEELLLKLEVVVLLEPQVDVRLLALDGGAPAAGVKGPLDVAAHALFVRRPLVDLDVVRRAREVGFAQHPGSGVAVARGVDLLDLGEPVPAGLSA
ncbi:hypothetical protein T492DRAFT_1026987 [Pavlovales sp. CCMP2436]|nr:hypothetical protein T492DRAFT_1026987 [Pavlovales sp. CCMP2436]|mmetsp:Transcript_12491/g.31628  ORF Transcript_12491/g.31628 Transcript_12491/m.31628 type:complete len:222 (+) Transcript_12491:304-969(+)